MHPVTSAILNLVRRHFLCNGKSSLSWYKSSSTVQATKGLNRFRSPPLSSYEAALSCTINMNPMLCFGCIHRPETIHGNLSLGSTWLETLSLTMMTGYPAYLNSKMRGNSTSKAKMIQQKTQHSFFHWKKGQSSVEHIEILKANGRWSPLVSGLKSSFWIGSAAKCGSYTTLRPSG